MSKINEYSFVDGQIFDMWLQGACIGLLLYIIIVQAAICSVGNVFKEIFKNVLT